MKKVLFASAALCAVAGSMMIMSDTIDSRIGGAVSLIGAVLFIVGFFIKE